MDITQKEVIIYLFDQCKRKEPGIMGRNLSSLFTGEGSATGQVFRLRTDKQ
jgi:hypothetical protein